MVTIMYDQEPALQDIFSKAVFLKLRGKLKPTVSVRVFWMTGEEIKVTIYAGEMKFSKIYANAFTMLINGMTSDWLVKHILSDFHKFVKSYFFA